ncbi:MAG: O-antigen ligase family protein, partial [Pseudomonadota bacterium]
MHDFTVRRSPQLSLAQAVLGWATLAFTLFIVIFHGGNEPAYWTLLALLIGPLFALQLGLGVVRGTPSHSAHILVPALLYLGALTWGMLQTIDVLPAPWAHPAWQLVPSETSLVSATPVAGQHTVMRLATYAMVFWIAMQASINAERALAFLRTFALFSVALAAFGLWAVLSGSNAVLDEQATANVSATFVNRNSYATYAAFGFVVNLGLYMHVVRERGGENETTRQAARALIERFFSGAWVFAFGAAICLSALLLTASRAGVVAGFVGLVTLLVAFRRGTGRGNAIWLSIIGILGAFAAPLSERVFSRVIETGSELRFVIYREMIANLESRLFLGHGLGAFQDTFRPFVPLEAAAREWARAHSSYLENLWELGLPAATAFYVALAWVGAVLVKGVLLRRRKRIYSSIALA